MTDVPPVERRLRRWSIAVTAAIVLLWLGTAVWFVRVKVVPTYRQRHTVDYAQVFDQDGSRDFTYMKIFLNDQELGFTQSVVKATEGGGRLITSETSLTMRTPIVSGAFTMTSNIHLTPERRLDRFDMEVFVPVGTGQKVDIEGHAEGADLVVSIPAFGYREVIPLADALISSGISPFTDLVATREGQSWEMRVFDPLQRRVQRLTVTVAQREEFMWRGGMEMVFRLECRDEGGAVVATAWVDRYGRILEQTVTLMGLTLTLKKDDPK
ncbi:MAG: hypothetical protein ABIF71_08810 [Planctomycetota bacterium]